MLKSVKLHFFLIITKFWEFKKSTVSRFFFTGFRINFRFQTDALEILKNHFSQKKESKN